LWECEWECDVWGGRKVKSKVQKGKPKKSESEERDYDIENYQAQKKETYMI
jgi:hypothetical protein